MRSLWIRWWPPLTVMAVIFFFSSRTGDDLDTVAPFFRYFFPNMKSFDWGHFIAYFCLSLSFLWAIGGKKTGWKAGVCAVLLSLAYGMTDEYHQTFVANRTSDWHDLRNDGIGAAIAVLILYVPPVGRLYAKLPHAKKY